MSTHSLSLTKEVHDEVVRISNEHGGVPLVRITEMAVRAWAKLPFDERIRALAKEPIKIRRGPRRKTVTT